MCLPLKKNFKKRRNDILHFSTLILLVKLIIVIGTVEFKVCFFAIYVMAGLLWYHC